MDYQKKVLVIDDDKHVLNAIINRLNDQSIGAVGFTDPIQAIENLELNPIYYAVITDVRMETISGLELLKLIKKNNPELPVIIITAFSDEEIIIEALRAGAYDYIKKPITKDYLLASVSRAIEKYTLVLYNQKLSISILEKESYIKVLQKGLKNIQNNNNIFEKIIGSSSKMQDIFRLIQQVGDTDASILITGESGTGKELVAKALHNNSIRKNKPFVAINCGAIPENLIESELFGYEAGAFTGASKKKIGKFEFANGGTLFLDEIGELSLNLQSKLLRVLQEQIVVPVGSNIEVGIDVRVISATNQDLNKMIIENKFREDLFYRLNVIPISIPPLRERKEDILLLTMHFINTFNLRYKKEIKTISDAFFDFIYNNEWNGNIRELRNLIERSVILATSDVLDIDLILNKSQSSKELIRFEKNKKNTFKENLKDFEKSQIIDALKKNKGNIESTANELQLPVRTLYNKLKKYDIDHAIL